jgi:hypothetical protein
MYNNLNDQLESIYSLPGRNRPVISSSSPPQKVMSGGGVTKLPVQPLFLLAKSC